MNRPVLTWWLTILVGIAVLPWYAIYDGFWSFDWLTDGYPADPEYAPLVFLVAAAQKPWLWPLPLFLAAAVPALFLDKRHPAFVRCLLVSGGGGFAYAMAQGFAVGLAGWEMGWLEALFGPLEQSTLR